MINNLRYIGALGAVYVACAAVGTAQAAGPANTPPWLEAPNREYGLGDRPTRQAGG